MKYENVKIQNKEEVQNKALELLFQVIGRGNKKDVFLSILFDVILPTEQLALAKRITTMYLLLKNIDYIVIGDILKISAASIAKYKLLLDRSRGIKSILEEVIKRDKDKLFIRELFALLYGPGSYGINWKTAHKIQKQIKREHEQGI